MKDLSKPTPVSPKKEPTVNPGPDRNLPNRPDTSVPKEPLRESEKPRKAGDPKPL